MNSDTPDYYALLGVGQTATADQIKHAYRERAKAAHPDGGGDPTVMQAINEAHQILGDKSARLQYDRLREALAREPEHDPAADDFETAYELAMSEEMHRQLRRIQARASAWRIVRSVAPLAAAGFILGRFFAPYANEWQQQFVLAVLSFAPVYGLFCGLLFLAEPDLRLALHDLFVFRPHRPRVPWLDLVGLGIMMGVALPGLWLWSWLYLGVINQ